MLPKIGMITIPPRISVVVPTKNRVKDLEKCIDSLLNQTQPIDELIVIDASDNDETEKYIRMLKEKANFEIIYVKQTKGGLATARNVGNRIARGDIVFQLEDDVILDKDFIKEITLIFINDKRREIGGVCGINIEEDGIKSKIFSFLYSMFGLIFLRDSLRKGSVTIAGHHARHPSKPSYVEWIFNGAYRREVLNEFKYDENLEALSTFAYYDDFDFSYRVRSKYKLFLTPRAKYVHRSSLISHSHTGAFETNYVKIQNHYYLVKKHNFSKVAFWWSVFGLLLAHLICLTLRPSKENYMTFIGLIHGISDILKGRTIG
jgi:GT2 family glycosyltransferase